MPPDRPWAGVGVVVLRGDAVLLIRRGRAPGLGEWSLPGGAQQLGETAAHAARRELAEETGLRVGDLTFLGHADLIDRDPEGVVRHHYTILDFLAYWQAGEPIAASDAAEAIFVPSAALSDFRLSSTVAMMIDRALRFGHATESGDKFQPRSP